MTSDPTATRNGRYRLREPLFRFWFRYVYGQSERLVRLGEDAFEEVVAPTFADYMVPAFETVCARALPSLVPKTYRKIGRWWYDGQELDVVGLAGDGTLVVGECKYTSREMTEGDLADLERTAEAVRWTPDGGGEPTHHYCCFCRSGFSDGLRATADRRSDVSLFTPADIVG